KPNQPVHWKTRDRVSVKSLLGGKTPQHRQKRSIFSTSTLRHATVIANDIVLLDHQTAVWLQGCGQLWLSGGDLVDLVLGASCHVTSRGLGCRAMHHLFLLVLFLPVL